MQSQFILILDQEEIIRDSFQLVLSDEGFICFTTPDDSSALQLLAHRMNQFNIELSFSILLLLYKY